MEMTRCLLLGFEASKAYLFLTLNELFLAVFMILVQSLTSNGVSALVLVVYEHVIATVLLSFLAFFLERSKVNAKSQSQLIQGQSQQIHGPGQFRVSGSGHVWPNSDLVVENLQRCLGLCSNVLVARVANAVAYGDRSSGFSTQEAEEYGCVFGFSKGRLVLHKSEIHVTGLLKFVDLGHSIERWWLRDAVESRSNKQACVTSDGGVHVLNQQFFQNLNEKKDGDWGLNPGLGRWNNRPPFSIKILCYAFLLGLLQISLSQVLFTMSLQFVASTYQSVGLNLIPSLVFVMALIFHQEKLKCWSINGQAKIWGLALTAAGALVVLLWKGPVVLNSMFNIQATSDVFTGSIMIIVGVLAKSFSNILVGHVIQFCPAELSLTAMMSLFGTIQTAVVSAFVISWSSWDLKWEKGLVLVTILLGGIVVTGLSYYVMTWSIKKKGPVFTSAFDPLLVVFSFFLQTFVLGNSAYLGSIVGAVLVILGLYLILWAKNNDMDNKGIVTDDSVYSPLIQP
uniref:EamA domain-containing protein n=1 Tax=Quercus lobata TaxID=97700 RepID=A0A7N2MTS0_QUELO